MNEIKKKKKRYFHLFRDQKFLQFAFSFARKNLLDTQEFMYFIPFAHAIEKETLIYHLLDIHKITCFSSLNDESYSRPFSLLIPLLFFCLCYRGRSKLSQIPLIHDPSSKKLAKAWKLPKG